MMDRVTLSFIDEGLDSSEVEALCFLCSDNVQRKRLEGIKDAKSLFLRLEEKGLLENDVFLSQLLRTLRRTDLLHLLRKDDRQPEETDSSPILSNYRVMLYRIYDDMTTENYEKLKFLLSDQLNRRQIDSSKTVLDLFLEMEKSGLMSNTNVDELLRVLRDVNSGLASMVQKYKDATQLYNPPHVSTDNQRVNNDSHPQQPFLPIAQNQLSYGEESVYYSDAQPCKLSSSCSDQAEYYPMVHQPRGMCVIINNENFIGFELRNRKGSQEDERALGELFTRFGFAVKVHNDLSGKQMLDEIANISRRNFQNDDALVICVLSHGEMGCVFGSDEKKVMLRDLTFPFTSNRAPTLAGKPKLFFIQACQGNAYQKGTLPFPPKPKQEETKTGKPSRLEEDAGPVLGETVPSHADFLLGMATVEECKSFRHTSTGSIYIQELCRQLTKSAELKEPDDILSVLTRVNREVSRGDYSNHKQMPEPKYTLTKKLVLKFISPDGKQH